MLKKLAYGEIVDVGNPLDESLQSADISVIKHELEEGDSVMLQSQIKVP